MLFEDRMRRISNELHTGNTPVAKMDVAPPRLTGKVEAAPMMFVSARGATPTPSAIV